MILNNSAPRSMAVINPIKLLIENYPEGKIESLQAPIHPQNARRWELEKSSLVVKYILIKKIF